jgi:hypothetical protein
MNARKIIVTVGAVVALAVPAVQPAGATIPSDADAGVRLGGTSLHKVKASTSGRQQVKGATTAIRLAAYPR